MSKKYDIKSLIYILITKKISVTTMTDNRTSKKAKIGTSGTSVSGTWEQCIEIIGKENFCSQSDVQGDKVFNQYVDTLAVEEKPNTLMKFAYEQITSRARANMYFDGNKDFKENLIQRICKDMKDLNISSMIYVAKCQETEEGEDKWTFTLYETDEALIDKITRRMNDRVNPHRCEKTLWELKSTAHDSVLGKQIVDDFKYSDVPWAYKNSHSCTYNPSGRTRGDRNQSDVTHFAGNMSVIYALGDPFNLGVIHGSHHGPSQEDGKIHQGCTSLVQIPPRCMIIFNGNLYHYGARSMFNGFRVLENVREFSYLVSEGVSMTDIEATYPSIEHKWCQIEFEKCKMFKEYLRDKRCDEHMVWKYQNNPMLYHPGEYIMGDIDGLWLMFPQFSH